MQNCQFVRHAQGAPCSLEQRPNPDDEIVAKTQCIWLVFRAALGAVRAPKRQKKCRRPAKDADIKFFIVVAVGVKDAFATYFT